MAVVDRIKSICLLTKTSLIYNLSRLPNDTLVTFITAKPGLIEARLEYQQNRSIAGISSDQF